MSITKKTALALADRLGIVLAAMAPFKLEEKSIKESLGDFTGGAGDVDGKFFHVNVTTSYRDTTPKKLIEAKLATLMTPKAFKAFMKSIESESEIVTVRCSAHLASPKQDSSSDHANA